MPVGIAVPMFDDVYIILAEQRSPLAVINPLYLPRTPNGGNNTGRPGRAVISPWGRCHLAGVPHRDSSQVCGGAWASFVISYGVSAYPVLPYRVSKPALIARITRIVMAAHLLVLLRKCLFLCYCIFSFQDTQKDHWMSLQRVNHGDHRPSSFQRVSSWEDPPERTHKLFCYGRRNIRRW